MSKSHHRTERVNAAVWGLILIAAGVWFLLDALGIPVPGMHALWPIFPTVVGLGFFAGWLFSSDKAAAYGLAIPGTINLLVGLFFFSFTLGFFEWGDMAFLWPVFPLIVGVAFIVAWAFSLFKEWGLLIPGGITGTVGLVGLAFTLGRADNAYLNLLAKGWPVLIILSGLITIVASLTSARRAPIAPAPPIAPESPARVDEGARLEDFAPEEKQAREYKRSDE